MLTRSRAALALCLFSLLAICGTSFGGIAYYTVNASNSGEWAYLCSVDTTTDAVSNLGQITGLAYVKDLAMNEEGDFYAVGWAGLTAKKKARMYGITPGGPDAAAQFEQLTLKGSIKKNVMAAVAVDEDVYVASSSGHLQKLVYEAAKDRWRVIKTGKMGKGNACDGDLAYDPTSDTMYISLAGGRLGTVNFDASNKKTFGQVTVLGPTGYPQISGLAMINGMLYGSTGDYGVGLESYLVELSVVGGVSAGEDVLGLADAVTGLCSQPLAAGDGEQGIPEPASITLLGLGAAALLRRRKTVA